MIFQELTANTDPGNLYVLPSTSPRHARVWACMVPAGGSHHCPEQAWPHPTGWCPRGSLFPRQAGTWAASPAPLSHLGLTIPSAVWEPTWHEQGINTGLTIAPGTGRSRTPAAPASPAKINMLQAKVMEPVNIKSASCIMHSNAGVREGDNMIHLPDSSF